jgi:hypothetical protein
VNKVLADFINVVLIHTSKKEIAPSDKKGQLLQKRLPSHLPDHPSAGIGTVVVGLSSSRMLITLCRPVI